MNVELNEDELVTLMESIRLTILSLSSVTRLKQEYGEDVQNEYGEIRYLTALYEKLHYIKEPVTWMLHEGCGEDEDGNEVEGNDEYAIYNEGGQAIERDFETLDDLVNWVEDSGQYRLVDSFVQDRGNTSPLTEPEIEQYRRLLN